MRLGRVLCGLLPRQPEAAALLGLMLLAGLAADARVSAEGEWFCWKSKIGVSGTRNRFRKERILWNRRCAVARWECTRYKPHRSPGMPMRKQRKRQTGPRIAYLYDVLLRTILRRSLMVNRAGGSRDGAFG